MTITRVNGASWGVGDKLTSAQMNGVDLNTTYALDKRAGQTDSLASVVSASGAGRLVGSYALGANADTTYLVSNANGTIHVTALTADRNYTLSNSNAVTNDRMLVLNESSFYITVKNAAAATLITLGSTVQPNGESTWAEFMFTGTAWILLRSTKEPTLAASVYNGDGTWTCPRGVTMALMIGWGGGGGGGAGGSADTGTAKSAGGGGGGGAALCEVKLVTGLTPGSIYGFEVGDGGVGAAAGSGGNGAAGGDTAFNVSTAVFTGASGGRGGFAASSTDKIAPGGGPSRDVGSYFLTLTDVTSVTGGQDWQRPPPNHGGAGTNKLAILTGIKGGSNADGGGALGGSAGATVGTAVGGGGGGGGGNGNTGLGSCSSGGDGGTGSNTGATSGNGQNAGPAGGNCGGGGGGGGAPGQNTGGGGLGIGGKGGDGGAGRLTIIPWR